jgi:hypothetical protein
LVRIKGSTEGFIAVRETIREVGKKNFTIAHELGHLLLPGHDESTVCLQGDVEAWDVGLSKQELEANEFAGELLLPTRLIQKLLSTDKPSFELIESLATRFSTSLTATAYRFAEATSHACAVVWSERGSTKWFVRSEEFRHWIQMHQSLDRRTLAVECFSSEGAPRSQEKVSASAWLVGDIPEGAMVVEHTRCMPSYGGALTLLWLPEPFATNRDGDEMLEELGTHEFGVRRKRWRESE